MSGFKDTFTKDEEQEGPQMYDDVAFYYFASAILLTIAVPWTWSLVSGLLWPDTKVAAPGKTKQGSRVVTCKTAGMIEKQASHRARLGSFGAPSCWWVQIIILGVIWFFLATSLTVMGGEREINRFDPFHLLDVSSSATPSEIKKAYRKLSLVWHPDKNPDDPLAEAHFIQITKAYAALTDETAKSNYEKYGNPDGPQTTKVGIGLPRFLLEKGNQFMILCSFFFLLIFFVPLTFICYYQRTKDYAGNGVKLETLHFMGYYINESTRAKNCPELLAASSESRDIPSRPTDNAAMRPIAQEVVEHVKRNVKFEKHPVIIKSSFLVGAHMQRLHHLLTPELREDLDTLLCSSMRITQAMIEIACMREWFFTAQAMIEFRRCLIQGIDIKESELLQVPHFTKESVKHVKSGKSGCSSLLDFISKPADQRKGMVEMNDQQVLDVEAFCKHVSDMEIQASVSVEDESEIVVGDIATATIQMKRRNLQDGEALGPVHAPLFPEPKTEEWWIFLVESMPSTRIIGFEKVRNVERFVEEKLRFPIAKPGKYKMDLHIMCDTYVGLDRKIELNFTAHSEHEVKRDIITHKEDEDLDLQPTLFQQFMGDFGGDEESEEEEDEPAKKKAPAREKIGGAGAPKSDTDTGDEKSSSKNAKDDDEDDSSDSSSDDSD